MRLSAVVTGILVLAGFVGMVTAGNIDSPGAPSAGSGMYTFQNLWDYLINGTALTVADSFQEPTAGPASTMKNTKEIGDGIKALYDQCDAVAAAVALGKKFFSTQSGSWGVQTGSLVEHGLPKTSQQPDHPSGWTPVTGDDAYYANPVSPAKDVGYPRGLLT